MRSCMQIDFGTKEKLYRLLLLCNYYNKTDIEVDQDAEKENMKIG